MSVEEQNAVLDTAAGAYQHFNNVQPGFSIEDALSYALEEHEDELTDCSKREAADLLKELFFRTSL